MFQGERQSHTSVPEAQTGLALGQRFGQSRAPHAPGARGALSFRRLG